MNFKMKVTVLMPIFVSLWAICSGNEDLELVGKLLQNVHQQVDYGMNLKPESQHPMVEYSPAVAKLLEKGVKSLLMERSEAVSYVFSNVSHKCRNDTNTMFEDLLNGKAYAANSK